MATARRLAMHLVAIGALAGCGGDTNPVEPLPDGTFEARIAGDANSSLRGAARLAGDDDWVIVVMHSPNGESPDEIVLNFRDGRPSPGTYALSAEAGSTTYAAVMERSASLGAPVWVSSSGPVRVTASSAERLEGAMAFEATAAFASRVSVSGRFAAVP